MATSTDEYRINKFYENLKDQGARFAFQYQISVSRDGLEDLQFWASAASVPGRTITSQDFAYQGLTFRVPSTVTFESPWAVTIRCDQSMTIRDAIEDWFNEFADVSKGGGGDKTIPDYRARVDLLDESLQNIVKTYVIEGIYPESYGAITLDTTDGGISTFDCNLAFQYYYPEDKGDPLKS